MTRWEEHAAQHEHRGAERDQPAVAGVDADRDREHAEGDALSDEQADLRRYCRSQTARTAVNSSAPTARSSTVAYPEPVMPTAGKERGRDDGEKPQDQRAGEQFRHPEQPQLRHQHLSACDRDTEDGDLCDDQQERAGEAEQPQGRSPAIPNGTNRFASSASRTVSRIAAAHSTSEDGPRTRGSWPRAPSSTRDASRGCPPEAGRSRRVRRSSSAAAASAARSGQAARVVV